MNAVTNASCDPVSEEEILEMLRSGSGATHQVRALFGDCDFDTLDRLCALHDISRATLRAACARARREVAASGI